MLRSLEFVLPSTAAPARLSEAALIGMDRMPWASRVDVRNRRLSVKREMRESACLALPWRVRDFGELVLETASLMERDEPYQVAVELARGQLNKVRNKLLDWEVLGLRIPPAVLELVRKANQELARAVVGGQDAEAAAESSLHAGLWAGELLSDAYTRQAAGARHRKSNLTTRVGGVFDDRLFASEDVAVLRRQFDHFSIPLDWRSIEPQSGDRHWEPVDRRVAWCLDHGFACTIGPMIDFDPEMLPHWMLQQDDPEAVAALILDFLESAVQRYSDRIQSWEATAHANSQAPWGYSEDRLLWLTLRSVEAIAQQDPQARVAVVVDRPWGDYLRQRPDRIYSPLTFVDQLTRSAAPVGSLVLEVAAGFAEGGGRSRSALDFGTLLDQYDELGLPIQVRLHYPSGPVPLAGGRPRSNAGRLVRATAQAQAEWLEGMVGVALSRPHVDLVAWGQIHDTAVSHWPNAGLIDSQGKLKPAWHRLSDVRRRYFR